MSTTTTTYTDAPATIRSLERIFVHATQRYVWVATYWIDELNDEHRVVSAAGFSRKNLAGPLTNAVGARITISGTVDETTNVIGVGSVARDWTMRG